MSNACNLKCVMCPRAEIKRETTHLSFENVKKMIDSFPENRVGDISAHGWGEPLCNPDLPKIIEYISKVRPEIYTYIRTNGLLLTAEKSEALLKSGLKSLQFSIDGYDDMSYDSIRGKGNFQKLLQNLDTYMKLKKKLRSKQINFIITVKTEKSQPKKVIQKFEPMMPVFVKSLHNWDESENKTGKLRSEPCLCPINSVFIRSNGDISLCCYDLHGDIYLGNISKDSLFDIWNGEKLKNIRTYFRTNNMEKIPEVCKTCHFNCIRSIDASKIKI